MFEGADYTMARSLETIRQGEKCNGWKWDEKSKMDGWSTSFRCRHRQTSLPSAGADQPNFDVLATYFTPQPSHKTLSSTAFPVAIRTKQHGTTTRVVAFEIAC